MRHENKRRRETDEAQQSQSTGEAEPLPRQEDLRQMARENTNTIAPFSPGILDVHMLLLFANRVQTLQREAAPLQRRIPRDEDHLPSNSPTSRPWRLSKPLDALANICVARARGDMVATAIRSHESEKRVVLFNATNDNSIPQSTIAYVEKSVEFFEADQITCN